MKLDTTNWPTIREKKPAPYTTILLYQGGHPFMINVGQDRTLYVMGKDCNNKECHWVCDDCDCEFIVTDDDKWMELPTK